MTQSRYLVEIEGLCKSYAAGLKPVLQGLDIKVNPGDRVVVIGPSGGEKAPCCVC